MSHQSPYPTLIDLLLKVSDDAVLIFSPSNKKLIGFNHKVVDLFSGESVDENLLERLFFFAPSSRDVITSRSGSIIRLRNFKIGKQYCHLEMRLKNIEDKNLGTVTIAIIKDLTQQFKWQKMQEALVKISESVASSKDLSELLVEFHQIINQIMPASNFYVAFYNPDQNQISFPYYVDEFDTRPPPQPLGRGLTDYVIRRKTPLLVTPEIFEPLVKTGEVESIGAPSIDWLGVPLLARQVIIGAMAVQSYQHDVRYTQEDLQFLTFVAPHLANAILIKQSETEQRKQHELVKSIFEYSPNAIVLTDLNGNFIDCNAASISLLGVQSKDEIIGKNALEFIVPDDQKRAIRYFDEIIASANSLEDEFTAMTPHGRKYILKISASLIKIDFENFSFAN